MTSVLQDLPQLAEIFGVPLAAVRHVTLVDDFDLQSGPPGRHFIRFMVPDGQLYVVTGIGVESYPLDTTGTKLLTERRPGAFADPVTFAWFKNDTPTAPDKDYRHYTGRVFIICSKGETALRVAYTAGAGDPATQHLCVKLNGYMVDVPAQLGLNLSSTQATTPD